MAPCHHTWHQSAKDEVSSVNGLVTTRYTHQCPQCGKIKTTVRASRKLPPEQGWLRELEKLILRAQTGGYTFCVPDGSPLTCSLISVKRST